MKWDFSPKFFAWLIATVLLAFGIVFNQINPQEQKPTTTLGAGVAQVEEVVDGDTIKLSDGQTVRYVGMDTPETVDPRKPVGCFGQEASKANKELVEGKTVRLEKDVGDKDKYGRLLRYVFVKDEQGGETFVNLELVKRGFAMVETVAPNVKYQDQFLEAQQEARNNNLGLWASCPLQ
jgi:micrococcal nuclease